MRDPAGPALIVGASGGIGGALYQHLSRERRVVSISSQAKCRADWFESDYSESSLENISESVDCRFSLIIICNGFLHGDGLMPEKRVVDLEPQSLALAFERNAIIPSMVLKHFRTHIEQVREAHCGVLSARIGSIGDNRSGGWYSYRCSKAALNMIVKTLAIELGRTHKNLALVALHPGTTQSNLSDPFLRRSSHQRASAKITAQRIERVLTSLTPLDSGGFFDWQGNPVQW